MNDPDRIHAYYLAHRDTICARERQRQAQLQAAKRAAARAQFDTLSLEAHLLLLTLLAHKPCRCCPVWKHADEFYVKSDGYLSSLCRSCTYIAVQTRRLRPHVKALRQVEHARHYAKYPEHAVYRNALRRSRMKGLESTLTRTQWQTILSIYRHRCAYCGKPGKKFHKEHVIPVIQGGGFTADNIVPACALCNSKKGTKPAPTYQPMLMFL